MNSDAPTSNPTSTPDPAWWLPVILAACAGGMGWGIRGQYGHETGAMIAGVLVCLTLVMLLGSRLSLSTALRAIAWGTVAMGIGGSMTYGQTIGLTQDASLIGNHAALRWGLLGLGIKGGLWIGFCGLFLGMGLGGVRYGVRELLGLLGSLILVYLGGLYLFNSPFDPSHRLLPTLYFSATWDWFPDAENLKPRRELWGGLLLVFIALLIYVRGWKQDRLAFRLAWWGVLGGALGFPLGQCIQAYHAWNPAVFTQGFWLPLAPHINWWNMMEITFGTVMGAMLGLGLWLNRGRIQETACSPTLLPPALEWTLVGIHGILLVLVEFSSYRLVDLLYDPGYFLALLPLIAIAGGRWWPCLVVFPLVLLPISGKTIRALVYNEAAIQPVWGWVLYLILPLVFAIAIALWLQRQTQRQPSRISLLRWALLFNTWLYFALNFAFFRFPWPWAEWTARTPSGLIFTGCALALTAAALWLKPVTTQAATPVPKTG